jgi:sulfur-carrier protein
MRIILRYYADYREIMGMKEMLMDLKDGQTIRGLLSTITNKYPELKTEIFEDQDDLKEIVTVLINGRSIEFLERMNTRLQDGDMISMFPPAHGG